MRYPIALLLPVTFAAAATTFVSCGAKNDSRPSSSADAGSKVHDAVTPPKEYYDALLADRMEASDLGIAGSGAAQVLYINFDGATVKKGYSRGTSFIPCFNETKIPASGLSASEQQKVMEKVAQYYSNAGTRIELTYSEPSFGDFTTMHVGGKYSDLGCVGGASTLGIAPFDTSNANPNDIGFVFIPKSRDVTTIAQTISHEAGHSFGLDHTDNRKDLMFPTVSSQALGFDKGIAENSRKEQDGPALLQATLGSGSASVTGVQIQPTQPLPNVPSPSTPSIPNMPNIPNGIPNLNHIPGLTNLGNISQLLGQLSPTLVSSLSGKIPQISNLPGGVNLQNPTDILALLTVLQGATTQQNGQFSINGLTQLIANPQFAQLTQILALVGLAGANPALGVAAILPIIVPTLNSVAGGTSGTVTNSAPVDLAALLNLSSVQNPGQLIALIPQYSGLIQANSQGAQAQAMMDLVKMAIAAQYKTI